MTITNRIKCNGCGKEVDIYEEGWFSFHAVIRGRRDSFCPVDSIIRVFLHDDLTNKKEEPQSFDFCSEQCFSKFLKQLREGFSDYGINKPKEGVYRQIDKPIPNGAYE